MVVGANEGRLILHIFRSSLTKLEFKNKIKFDRKRICKNTNGTNHEIIIKLVLGCPKNEVVFILNQAMSHNMSCFSFYTKFKLKILI